MKEMKIRSIGNVVRSKNEVLLKLEEKYKSGLTSLDKFSHVIVVWWADGHEDEQSRQILVTELPYAAGEKAGVFACRAEYRPNPIAITVCPIKEIDQESGIVKIAGIDARDNSKILDLKPYIPVCDRVNDSRIPEWFDGWPLELPENGLQLEY
ncbi:MAG: TrmO family methyltransferase [Candidatus Cloacimonetes bacterium]|nr:TrmO family methyltransferase [Candidatus Cloacimonadota bacterium]